MLLRVRGAGGRRKVRREGEGPRVEQDETGSVAEKKGAAKRRWDNTWWGLP